MENTQGPTSTGPQDQKSDREGMIQVNDLVYKLEPDISVAVNRTHKTHFFQQTDYKNSQTAVCILNSGADYIDCRRSFLNLRVNLTCDPVQIGTSDWDTWHGTDTFTQAAAQAFNDNLLIHGYFGPNGSILNLIDTVTVTTRSGDELSRVTDLALLSNMTLPLIFGKDWRSTVGQMMGMGDCAYGQSSKRKHPCADRTYAIPLYLLSPLFQYGRLMPSMLMSGLRITITWKSAMHAFAQFVAKCPADNYPVNVGGFVAGCGFNETAFQNNEQKEVHTTESGDLPNGLTAEVTTGGQIKLSTNCTRGTKYEWLPGDIAYVGGGVGAPYLVATQTSQTELTLVQLATGNYTAVGAGSAIYRVRVGSILDDNVTSPCRGAPQWDPAYNLADAATFNSLNPGASAEEKADARLHMYESRIQQTACPTDGHRGDGRSLERGENGVEFTWPVHTMAYPTGSYDPDQLPDYWGTGVESLETVKRMQFPSGTTQFVRGTMVPGYKYKGGGKDVLPFPGVSAADMTNSAALKRHPRARRKYFKNPEFITSYTIVRPEFSLCSVQLSDAIQRTLNEYSAVNGLEIVYTDYDLTCSPVPAVASGASVYTEVRKSASRALQAIARICPLYSDEMVKQTCDSNASTIQYAEDLKSSAKGWVDYQWQLGSLYFPQQKVQSLGQFDMGPLAYAYTLEAFDRFSGAASCMLRLTGKKTDRENTGLTRTLTLQNWTQVPGAAPPDLLSQERLYMLGKPGSFQGGGEVIAVSLERSSLFNLSGIPINNSRVLALRGMYSSYPTKYCPQHTLNIYLKYVKLARIFLNNVEVEQ